MAQKEIIARSYKTGAGARRKAAQYGFQKKKVSVDLPEYEEVP
jgi:hypothetical protein